MRRSGPVAGFAVWLVGMLVLAVVDRAGALELHGLFTSSAQLSDESIGESSFQFQTFLQNLELNLSHTVSPLFSYRTSLRASDEESAASAAGRKGWASTQEVEPYLELTLRGSKFSLTGGARFLEVFADSGETDRVRTDANREFVRFFWTPESLPRLSFQYDRFSQMDDRSFGRQDSTDQRFIVGLDYEVGKLTANYTFTDQISEDFTTGRDREIRTHLGSLLYQDTFWNNRIATSGGYQVNYFETIQKFPVASTGIGVRPILRALSGFEPNPLTTNILNYPLAATTAVTDGNLATGISLLVNRDVAGRVDGIVRNCDTSVVAELTGIAEVSLIRLNVAVAPGDPFPLDAHVTAVLPFFRLFSSQDNLTWVEVPPGPVIRTFDPVESRIDFGFASVSARFFKVVLTDDPRQPTFPTLLATELSLEGPVRSTGQQRLTTSNLQQTGTVGLSVTPVEMVVLSYNGTFTNSLQGEDNTSDWTGTQAASITVSPHTLLAATALYQNAFTSTDRVGGIDTHQNLYSLTLSSSPLPTLNSSLSFARNQNFLDSTEQSRVDSLTFTTAAKPYRLLSTDLNFTASKIKTFLGGTDAFVYSINLNANAQLRPNLIALATYSYQHSDVTGPIEATTSSNVFDLRATYTLSRVVNLNFRATYVEATDSRVVTQEYRLDWIPTSKTSFFLQFLRDDRLEPRQEHDDRLTATGTWNISRLLDLSLSYTLSRLFNSDISHTGFGTLSFRF